jgi:hypothetical protein
MWPSFLGYPCIPNNDCAQACRLVTRISCAKQLNHQSPGTLHQESETPQRFSGIWGGRHEKTTAERVEALARKGKDKFKKHFGQHSQEEEDDEVRLWEIFFSKKKPACASCRAEFQRLVHLGVIFGSQKALNMTAPSCSKFLPQPAYIQVHEAIVVHLARDSLSFLFSLACFNNLMTGGLLRSRASSDVGTLDQPVREIRAFYACL